MSGLRIGLLGYGAIARQHARALRGLGCELVAVAGPRLEAARAFADEHGAARATVAVPDVVGAPDVDAVVVASPNEAHVEQSLAALAAGKHVLCEVPLAMSAPDAERVAAAVRESGRLLTVCHTQRFWAPVAELRRQVDEGALHVEHVISRTTLPRRENVGWTGRPRSWVDSVLWHHGSHAVDTALWLLADEVAHVSAEAGRPHPETGRPLDVSILLRTHSGSLASLVLSYASAVRLGDILVIGAEETYTVADGTLRDASGAARLESGHEAMHEAAVAAQDAAFVAGVEAGEPAEPTADGVLAVYRVLQEAQNLIA